MAKRTRAGIPNTPPEKIEKGILAWLASGSSRIAAKKVGVDDATVRHWKERNPELWSKLAHAFEAETAASRPKRARLAAEVRMLATKVARERLRKTPDSLDCKDVAALHSVAIKESEANDHAQRLADGLPGEIIEFRGEDLDAELAALAAQYERKGARQ